MFNIGDYVILKPTGLNKRLVGEELMNLEEIRGYIISKEGDEYIIEGFPDIVLFESELKKLKVINKSFIHETLNNGIIFIRINNEEEYRKFQEDMRKLGKYPSAELAIRDRNGDLDFSKKLYFRVFHDYYTTLNSVNFHHPLLKVFDYSDIFIDCNKHSVIFEDELMNTRGLRTGDIIFEGKDKSSIGVVYGDKTMFIDRVGGWDFNYELSPTHIIFAEDIENNKKCAKAVCELFYHSKYITSLDNFVKEIVRERENVILYNIEFEPNGKVYPYRSDRGALNVGDMVFCPKKPSLGYGKVIKIEKKLLSESEVENYRVCRSIEHLNDYSIEDEPVEAKCWCCQNTNVTKGAKCRNCGEIV